MTGLGNSGPHGPPELQRVCIVVSATVGGMGDLQTVLTIIISGAAVLGIVARWVVRPWWRSTWTEMPEHQAVMLVIENRSNIEGRDVRMYVREHMSRVWHEVYDELAAGFGTKLVAFMSFVPEANPAVSADAVGILQFPTGVPKSRTFRVKVTWSQLPFLPLRRTSRFTKRLTI